MEDGNGSKKLLKNGLFVSSLVFLGKILGFIKQAEIAWAFGASGVTDTFFAADGYVALFSQIQMYSITSNILTEYRVVKSDHKIELNKGMKTFLFGCFRKMLHTILVLLPGREQFWYKKYCNFSDIKGDYVTNFDTMTYKEMFTSFSKCEDIFPIKYVKFEDFMMPVSNNVEETLKNMYGDFMRLPPLEKRVNHAPYILDFGDGINVMTKDV